MPSIHFNGRTYNDLAEMPSGERQAYEQLMSMFKDENQDGIPDIFQGDVVGNILKAATTTVVVDGQQVSGLGDLTPEKRAKIEKGLSKLKELGILSDVPDLLNNTQASPAGGTPTWNDAEIRSSQPIISSPSVIQEDTGPRWIILLTILIAAVILIAGVAALLAMGRGF